MTKINVYATDPNENFYTPSENIVVARVNYNNNLDYWNGSNWTNGGLGLHKGLTRLRNYGKSFVLIFGSQWQGSQDYGVLISDEQAAQEIMISDNLGLFEKYPDLEKYRASLETEIA